MMDNELTQYGSFIKDIKDLIYRRQYEALKKVNTELIQLYWEIGKEIERQQKEKGWGKSIVEILSKELQKEFPGVQGYSARNLWRMRNFYTECSQGLILPLAVAETSKAFLLPLVAETSKAFLLPLVAEISWTKFCTIIEKRKDPLEREFYIKMTKRYGWTKDVLINNIENRAFEKYMTNQTNFDETVPEKYRRQARLAVKDEYNFDFIEMGIECIFRGYAFCSRRRRRLRRLFRRWRESPMMIDAKSFMEFFEKECNVQFIDAQSGRRTLDIIAEKEQMNIENNKKNCITCKWAHEGDGKILHEGDRICVNRDSEYVTEWIFEDTVCEFWEKIEGDADE